MTVKSRFLAGALAVLVPSVASAAVIDFDDLAGGASVGASYAAQGVTFSNAVTIALGAFPGISSPNGIVSESDFSQPQPGNPIVAVFDFAVSFVSLSGVDVGASGFLLRAFDSVVGGSLVFETSGIGTGIGIGNFFDLFVTGSGIRRVEFSQVFDAGVGDGMAWDNLVFEPERVSAIPLPAALPMTLAGLGLLAAAGRRKRSA